ncbi:alkaline phosphatase family protein [Haloplanus sp. GCM10025708]|uniref:alkaline phosphatase family protein n=1 Tax=Haloferacaceae TaxID=1644056 RepID=UPI00360FA171
MTRIVVCLDGLDPAYLDAVETPAWDAIAAEGSAGTCRSVVPSLTNVNNVSIVTASFPAVHGVTGNTYFDRERGERVYMDDPAYRRCETRLQQYADAGEDVAALVTKEKLERTVGQGCSYAAAAEDPPAELEAAVGDAPGIYSGEASAWVVAAAEHVLATRDPDVCYVSTTDVVPHKHEPGTLEANEWVRSMDAGLGRLREYGDVVATADHGMREKTERVDVEAVLADEGYDATVVRLIRDTHTYHHRNLGGSAYVYLHDADDVAWLSDVSGVEAALPAADAAARFRLPADRIGDAMLLGTPTSVFGPVGDGATHDEVSLRSHGSHHERTVPYVSSVDCDLSYNVEAFDALGAPR